MVKVSWFCKDSEFLRGKICKVIRLSEILLHANTSFNVLIMLREVVVVMRDTLMKLLQ